jgi:hypothetical protein
MTIVEKISLTVGLLSSVVVVICFMATPKGRYASRGVAISGLMGFFGFVVSFLAFIIAVIWS